MTTLVSTRTLPTAFIDLFAAFFDDPFQFVGFPRRESARRASQNRLAFLLANPLKPIDEVRSHFQPCRRQSLKILDDVFKTAHDPKVHREGQMRKPP